METVLAAWHRVKALVLRRRLERDLDDELAFHLSMREAEYVRRGVAPDRAREAARRRFGNVAQFKEETRDMWVFPSFESLRQDVRFSFRALRRTPGFTLVAVVVLAIGIGGNTAIFSLTDAVRAQALPYKEPSRLVELWGNVMRARVERRGASYPDYLDWRARAKSFEDVAAFDGQTLTLTGVGEPERIQAEFVSAPYFSLLGVAAARGRTFRSREDRVAAPESVVVISDGLWRRHFGQDPGIVGRSVSLNASTYTIVGVMPRGFTGLTDAAELWVPFALYAPPTVMANRGSRGFIALARLKPGVTLAAAQAEMDGISRQLEHEHPESNERRGVEVSPLDIEMFGQLRPALRALMVAVGFVLLIACANVANLLIARSEVRRREIAVRTALGAGRARLLRQLVTESCLLTLMGAAAGLALARLTTDALIARSPIAFPSFVRPGLDARVAGFTILVSVTCGLLVGIAPGLQTRWADLASALKDSARGSGGPRSRRLRSGLIVAELAMAVVLLVGAALMIRSVRNLAALDPGFEPASLLTLRVSIPRTAAPTDTAATASGQPAAPPEPSVRGRVLVERLRAVPGVAAVALGSDLPLDGDASAVFYTAEGMPSVTAQTAPRAYIHRVSPGFFATLGIPLVAGRAFTENEMRAVPMPVVVSERVVTRFWPGQDPIGRRVKFGPSSSDAPWLFIIGVVREVKYRGLPDNPTADPDIYLPFTDRNAQVAVAVRATVPPSSLAAPLREAVREIDPAIPVYALAPMEDLVAGQTSQSRFTMWLMGVFAATALLLASIGIYGVMAYVVSQRTREIGIRMALGAARLDILHLIVTSGARLVVLGVAIGIVLALALERLMTTLVFGVTTADSAAVAAVSLLAAVALAACGGAAVRAMRVDPNLALRFE
jgi:predicted permease